MSGCTRMHTHVKTCTCELHMCTLLPKMCHQMSPPSASFNLAEQPVISLQMATSTLSLSLSLFDTHISTHFPCHFSLPPTSKSANLASVESLSVSGSYYLPLWSLLALWPSSTIALFILFRNISRPQERCSYFTPTGVQRHSRNILWAPQTNLEQSLPAIPAA